MKGYIGEHWWVDCAQLHASFKGGKGKGGKGGKGPKGGGKGCFRGKGGAGKGGTHVRIHATAHANMTNLYVYATYSEYIAYTTCVTYKRVRATLTHARTNKHTHTYTSINVHMHVCTHAETTGPHPATHHITRHNTVSHYVPLPYMCARMRKLHAHPHAHTHADSNVCMHVHIHTCTHAKRKIKRTSTNNCMRLDFAHASHASRYRCMPPCMH